MIITSTFIANGLSINKIDKFNNLFKELGVNLPSASNLYIYLYEHLKIHKNESRYKVQNKKISIFFDSSQLNQQYILCIIGRFIEKDKIVQKCLGVVVNNDHYNSRTLGGDIIDVTSKIDINKSDVVAFIRDSVTLNNVAVSMLNSYYTNSVDIKCYCHIMNNCGDCLRFELLESFLSNWNVAVSHIIEISSLWKTLTGFNFFFLNFFILIK